MHLIAKVLRAHIEVCHSEYNWQNLGIEYAHLGISANKTEYKNSYCLMTSKTIHTNLALHKMLIIKLHNTNVYMLFGFWHLS